MNKALREIKEDILKEKFDGKTRRIFLRLLNMIDILRDRVEDLRKESVK